MEGVATTVNFLQTIPLLNDTRIMKKIFSILLLLCVGFSPIKAQRPNSFSFDPAVFIGEFETFIGSSPKREVRDMAEEFTGYYNAGKFTAPQKNQIIKLCNEMLNGNCQISPDFEGYLKTINALVSNNYLLKFDGWHKTLSASLKKSKEDFQKFLLVSSNVFAENKLLTLGGFNWVTSTADADLIVEGEPLFLFKKLNLICYTPGDTFELYNTSGKFYPSKNLWVGKGGKVDWTRVGLDSNKVYALIKNYKLNLSDGEMIADSSNFYNLDLSSKPMLGKVTDRPMGKSQGDKSNYPQFEGYFATFTGASYGKAKFRGGFGMRGALVIGRGNAEQKAELWFTFKNKPFMRIQSPEFFVRENKISVDKAEVTLFLDKDSIYHPQLAFNYLIDQDKVSLYRDNKMGISSAPFMDNFHNIEFYVDEIKWDLNSPKIILDNISGDVPAKFESNNFFRDVNYEKIGGVLSYNPLQRIKKYCEDNKITSFRVEVYASTFKSNISDIRIQMIDLNDKGYVNFDGPKNMVYVKRKLIDYVNAHNGRTDYDAISFNSIISSIPNAHISLINNDLVVQGVPKFYFSDSQNVYIIPKDQVVTMKKNRTMDFSGKLRAGMADFYGNNFAFDYTSFKIRLNNVDSLKFLYPDDSLGMMMHVKSVIQNIYGTLEIDYPYNKSGRKRYPKYPVFTSEVGSQVYYDYPTTMKGSYDKSRFHFDVDPFTLDSLADLNLYTLALAGNFVSGGILPDMRQEIYLQPDRSLGFYIPQDSSSKYVLYGGKGSMKTDLRLSNDGLVADGTLSYLASRTSSHRFELMLDSLNSNSYMFENDRTSLFPTVIKSANVYNHWTPYLDTMLITNKGEPMKIAYDGAKLYGTIILTPKAMKARGNMDIEGGKLEANLFELKPVEVLSDDAVFKQMDPKDTTKVAFATGKVKAYVNLEQKYAEFTYKNFPGLNNNFILNNYAGSFEKLKWDMVPKTLEFKGPINAQNIEGGSYLVSNKKTQDSLKYSAGSVFLTLGDYVMHVGKIPFIKIADSKVFPDSGNAILRQNAEMDMMVHAKIKADTLNQYHDIENVTIKINGRTDCNGAGTYTYFDRNKKPQKFYLDQIYVIEKKFLEGKTLIPDTINFHVGPKISFRGNTILHSFNKNLEYNGFFKAEHTQFLPKTDWFKSAATINPDSVYINLVPPLTNLNRATLTNGFFVSNDSSHVYPAMFSRKRNTSDQELLKCEGTFTYNEKFDEFRLGPFDKVFGNEKRGNFMAMSEQKKIIYGEGKFNFGFNTQGFNITSAGYGTYSLVDTSFGVKLTMLVDMILPPQAVKLMLDSLVEQSTSASSDYFDKRVLKVSIPELVDDKTYKKLGDNMEDEISSKNMEDLQKTFFFSDVTLVWNTPSRTFSSTGDLGLRSIEKNLVERKIKGKIEITKKRGGDDLVIYLQQPGGSWYFFKYQKGVMAVISSDLLFNELIRNNIDKVSKEKEDYKIRQANISDRNKFVRAQKK
ncbi:MAG: hypothetical protein CFE21_02410 [Bacteroidetes bacterium B1(2017)]|nr:MAG: hypothetical protein CFE21_02410 [Bacteroidetes bacterium B1(2017)]